MALNFPASPSDGDVYENYVWNETVGAWQSQFTGGGGSIEVSSTAPTSPSAGDLWWDPDNGNLYIYYDDGTSQQWVAANGPQVVVSTSAPAGYQGQMWFDSTEGKTYIYYDDGTTGQWVSAIGGTVNLTSDQLPAGSIISTTSVTVTDTFSAAVGDGGNVPVTGLEITHAMQSASNKLLMIGMFGVCAHELSVNQVAMGFKISGNGLIGVAPQVSGTTAVTAGGRTAGSADSQNANSITAIWQYEPGTTDSQTYQVVAFNLRDDTRTVYVNRNKADSNTSGSPRGISTFTIMEVAG